MTHERTFLNLKHTSVGLKTFYRVPDVLGELNTIDTISRTDDLGIYDVLIIIHKDSLDSATDDDEHLIYRMMVYLNLRPGFHTVDKSLHLIIK